MTVLTGEKREEDSGKEGTDNMEQTEHTMSDEHSLFPGDSLNILIIMKNKLACYY